MVGFRTIERPPDAFQRAVAPTEITAMCVRAFGADVDIKAVTELAGGLYNNTYRVEINDTRPVILRVAPEPRYQSRAEQALMRNEYAALPYFAPLAAMMPRVIFADWSHEVVPRDYLWQSMLDGIPAATGLHHYPREDWLPFYRQLGDITKSVHRVSGPAFGPIAGPHFTSWSEAILASFTDIAADMRDVGLDATDVDEIVDIAEDHSAILDEITEPRLLHGDLWTQNVMLAAAAPEPTITGLLDHDRASWGDPAADWPLFVLDQRPASAQAAFRETYGAADASAHARLRELIYRARHIGAARLERHRLGNYAKVPASYEDMSKVITELRH